MDYQTEIETLELEIKRLTRERDALRAAAVEAGAAQWAESVRTYAPNLEWWKAQHPKTWERYVTTGTTKRFVWL